jgi:hypothetical protein
VEGQSYEAELYETFICVVFSLHRLTPICS